MRLLLDENLPRRLKTALPGHQVFTVRDMSWNGKKNGELLRLLLANGFEALLTFDKNLSRQQNFNKYPIPVLVLMASGNKFLEMQPLMPAVLEALGSSLAAGPIVIRG